MGCGQGKGNKKVSIKSIQMKKINVPSVDDFVEACMEVVEQFGTLAEPLDERCEKIMKHTGFEKVHHASIKHALIGLFLSFGTAVQGDMSKLKISVEDSSPYLKASIKGVSSKDLEEAYEDIMKYIAELEDILVN